MELNNWHFLKPLVLLAALKQFKYQATNRLLLAMSEEYGDSGTTKKKDVKKIPAKMLPSTLSKHCMCTISFFLVNNHGKQIWKLKNKKLNISGYSVKLPVRVLTIKYFISRWVAWLATDLQNDFSYGLNGSRNCCTCKLHMVSWESSHTLSFTAVLGIHTLGNTFPGSIHICYQARSQDFLKGGYVDV